MVEGEGQAVWEKIPALRPARWSGIRPEQLLSLKKIHKSCAVPARSPGLTRRESRDLTKA